ncbi:PASTA domain-containing protein [Streptococcus rifensis]
MAKPKFGKLAGRAFKVLNATLSVIPDTVEIAGKITDKAAPIVDKALDRRHEAKTALIQIPNVIDMPIHSAQSYLESIGFSVHVLPAKAHKKFAKSEIDEVVAMSPKSGKFKAGHLVKLYYLTPETLEASMGLGDSIVLPTDLKGTDIDEAERILTEQGFTVIRRIIAPRAELGDKNANQVIETYPKQTFLTKNVRPGTIIRLDYLDGHNMALSRKLLSERQAKQKETLANLNELVKYPQKLLKTKK